MSNLLCVDWDSFFPNPMGDPEYRGRDIWLYDWGHKEAPFFMTTAWSGRAEGFIDNDLPLPDLDGQEIGYWDRFKISKSAKLYYADSNACAVNPIVTGKSRRWDHVWLYDAHHDSGYQNEHWLDLVQGGTWGCDNWTVLYSAMGANLHVRYPKWRAWAMDGEPNPVVEVDRAVDDGSAPDVVFDRVFVCRSSAWVPPWLDIDARFQAFVDASPVPASRRWDIQPGGTTPREFDEAHVKETSEWRRGVFKHLSDLSAIREAAQIPPRRDR